MEITQAAFIVEFTRQKCLREGNEHNKTEFNEELRKQLGTGFPSAGSIFTKLRATGALKDTPTGYVFDIPGDVPIQEAYQRATGAVYTERYGCRMKQVPNWSDLFGPLPETTHEVDQTANEVDETELQLAVAEEAFEPATIIEKPDPTEARLLSMERQIGALTSALQFDKTAGNGQVATELQNLLKSQKGLVSMFNDRMQGLSDSIKGRGYRDLMKQFDNLTKEHGDLKEKLAGYEEMDKTLQHTLRPLIVEIVDAYFMQLTEMLHLLEFCKKTWPGSYIDPEAHFQKFKATSE